jgi:5'-3' exonuclease
MAFSFNEKISDENSTLIVDALNLAFRWKHQGRTDFRYEYERTVQSLATSYGCKRILITADWGSSTYRKSINSGYKQNRKEKIAQQSEEEQMQFEDFIAEFESSLDILKENHLVKYRNKYGLGNIWLVSSDKDWDLLIQENVSRFSYVTRKEITIENWGQHYEVSPQEYISLKCLTGDKGDNVPGIPGIGPKRALQLIKEYGDAFSIYDATPIPSSYKHIQALNQNSEQILQNYELMDLITYCDDAIGVENVLDIGRILNAA